LEEPSHKPKSCRNNGYFYAEKSQDKHGKLSKSIGRLCRIRLVVDVWRRRTCQSKIRVCARALSLIDLKGERKVLKQLGIGAIIFCVLGIAGLIAGDAQLIVNLAGGAALVMLALAAIFSGSLGSGDRIRAGYGHEDNQERQRRNQWTSSLLVMAVPNILGAVILFSCL